MFFLINYKPGTMFKNIYNKKNNIRQVQHKPDYAVYQTENESVVMMVLVDLALINIAPDQSFPTGLTIHIPYEVKREDRLPEDDQLNKLMAHEDVIINIAEKNLNHYHIATATCGGMRSVCFYISNKNEVRKFLNLIKKEIGTASGEFSFNEYSDPEWNSYLQGFYPNPFQMQMINNHRVVQQLKLSGDHSQTPREISHYAFFNDENQMKDYQAWLEKNSFDINTVSKTDTGEYRLEFTRIDMPDYNSINEVCLPLWDKADELGGKYDGWETGIVKM